MAGETPIVHAILEHPLCLGEPGNISDEAFSFAGHSRRMNLELSDQSEYIDMDLAIPVQWERLARGRRVQQSLDSQEFDFNMSSVTSDLLEQEQVAPADELFYKGQLLPLQPDPRLQLVQTLSSPDTNQRSGEEEESHMMFSSCRLDKVDLDGGLMDSRCSSFRSQKSGFWDSSGKDTGDSSSSRDSNGSSQDSCLSVESNSPVMFGSGEGKPTKTGSRNSRSHLGRRNPFSLKSLFSGLKRASKIRVDEREESANADHREQKRNTLPFNLRNAVHSFGNTSSGGASSKEQKDVCDRSHGFDSFVEKVKVSGGQKDLREGFIVESNTVSNSSGKITHPSEREKHRTTWHAKERWQRYAKKLKPLYVKITQKYEGMGLFSQTRMDDCEGASAADSTTTVMKSSSERRRVYKNLDWSYSSRYLTVASCPASMRSSPSHSGVLATTSKGTNSSRMQELQSAIQGAIAHCKESQAGKSRNAFVN